MKLTTTSLSLIMAAAASAATATAQEPADTLSAGREMNEVVVTARQQGVRKLLSTAQNTDLISAGELKRAACCNLGESFTTNPSVDVSYTDAATNARQIKLLGLSGTYVQMMTENVPNFRGAAAPYGLGYIAGPWLHSIQISKGASTVKSGYESITGQINIEMLKPQDDQSLALNAYADMMSRVEANASGNIHLSRRWSTGLLAHGEKRLTTHDGNGDGFIDQPRLSQLTAMSRWAYFSDRYIFQTAVKFLAEDRESGQDSKHNAHHADDMGLYTIDIDTRRWEAFAKNAFIIDPDNGTNIALILSGSIHDQDSRYGLKLYDVNQKSLYASLMFERDYGRAHSISAGLSFNYDHYDQTYRLTNDSDITPSRLKEVENVPGAYFQYTFNLNRRLLLMAGLRWDYSSTYGSMTTPRFHMRWTPADKFSAHASAGRGYHNPHRIAEYSYLLASSRRVAIDPERRQEDGWNFGGGITSNLYLLGRRLTLNAEYYFTRFGTQAVVDLDSDPHAAILTYNHGHSRSHTLQAELSYQPFDAFTFSAAYRYTDVKENYGDGLKRRPLTSASKGLFSISYTPMMEIWQFDATLAIIGGGRMPSSYVTADGSASWDGRYKAYPQLSAQVTRNFRHWALYIGGENLTGYKQRSAIIDAANPWGDNFDATMVYAPLHGATVYAGVRYNFTKY